MVAPSTLPKQWVVHCKCVGPGQKVLVYLGRYLYRGVIREQDILRCENGQVTYRWRDSDTKKMVLRSVSGAAAGTANAWRCCAWGCGPARRCTARRACSHRHSYPRSQH